MFWRTQTKLKGLTPAIGASPNFVLPQKVLSDSNNYNLDPLQGYSFEDDVLPCIEVYELTFRLLARLIGIEIRYGFWGGNSVGTTLKTICQFIEI